MKVEADKKSLEHAWALLEAESAPGEGHIPFRELDGSTSEGNALAALDEQGRRMLLLPAALRTKCSAGRGGKGIETGFSEWSTDGRVGRYYFIRCEDDRLKSVFCRVAEAVLERLATGSDACRAVADVLDEFRELLQRSRPRLSREEQLGLIAELMTLRSLLMYNPDAVSCWMGPRSARHDFIRPGLHLEVKAGMQQSAGKLRIHGVDQLSTEGTEVLYLLHYTFDETPGTDVSIPVLAQQCRQKAANKDAFDELLAEAGVLPETMDDLTFSVGLAGRTLYQVDEAFPKLTTEGFVGGVVPNGIIGLDYTIDMSTATSSISTDVTTVLQQLAAHGSS